MWFCLLKNKCYKIKCIILSNVLYVIQALLLDKLSRNIRSGDRKLKKPTTRIIFTRIDIIVVNEWAQQHKKYPFYPAWFLFIASVCVRENENKFILY